MWVLGAWGWYGVWEFERSLVFRVFLAVEGLGNSRVRVSAVWGLRSMGLSGL